MADADTLEKAQPDTGALKMGDFAVQASQKVQLDIDDAPFLLTPEEETPPPALREDDLPAAEGDDEEAAQKRARKKQLLLRGAAGVIVLMVVGAAVWWFFFSTPSATIAPAQPEPTIIVVPSPKTVAGPPEFKIEFAPFMVEQRDGNEVHFLQARFTGISQSEAVIREAQNKRLVLRDSIYYYLRNKTHQYLVDPANTMTIKQDLLDIVNGSLSQGKMDDILLVNYITK